jgi:hypothetical protein
MNQCATCHAPITPAEGPGLLWGPADGSEPRRPFHLACWLRLREPVAVSTAHTSRHTSRRAA